MAWIQTQLDSLLTFLSSLKDMIISYFSDIHHLFLALGRGVALLYAAINLLPPFLVAFATLTVVALVLLQVLGRSNSGG